MKTTTVLKAGATYGGPTVFGAGAAMLVAALVTSAPSHPEASAPRVTSTVTVPPAPVAAPRHKDTTPPRPSVSTSGPGPAAVAASDRRASMPHTTSGGTSHAEARPPSAPQPSPSPSPAAACDGNVLAVQLLRAACVTIGGSSK